MMAGILIISTLSGAIGAVAALVMAQPFWVALLAYPATGLITLVAVALWMSLRGSSNKGADGFAPAQMSVAYARRSN